MFLRVLAWIVAATLGGMTLTAEATSRQGVVYLSGQVSHFTPSQARPSSNGSLDCQAPNQPLFRFEESLNVDQVELSARDNPQGSASISITILESCFSGTLVFNYRHEAISGTLGGQGDLLVEPPEPAVQLAASPGSQATTQVLYTARRAAPFGSSFRFRMLAGGINFSLQSPEAGNLIGSANRGNLPLLNIDIAGRENVVETGDLPDPQDERSVDAGRALNRICESPAPPEFCEIIARAIDEAESDEQRSELTRRVTMAFDAHQVTSISAMSGEAARVQADNVGQRVNSLRNGGPMPNMSIDGLSMSYQGFRLDANLLPQSLLKRINGEDDIGSQLLSQPWGFFINGNIAIGDRSRRGRETGYDFDTWGVTSGFDYRFRGGHVAGVAVGYSQYSADLDEDGGAMDSDSWTVQAYGSWQFSDQFYADLTLGYTLTDFDLERVVDLRGIGPYGRRIARGNTDGYQFDTSIALNYRLDTNTALSITPYGQFNYARTSIDGFTESGTIFDYRYPSQNFDSYLFTGGVRLARPVGLERGVLVPFADLAVEYEAGLDSYTMQPVLAGSDFDGPMVMISDPDRFFARAHFGVSYVGLTGTQFFASYSALLLDSDTTRHSLYLGIRFEF